MDLSTNYLGLRLRNPLVASAGPLSQTVDGVRGLVDAGVGAVVMYSLFEEQVRRQAALDAELTDLHEESFPEALNYFPMVDAGEPGVADRYVALVEQAAAAVEVPVIASINGSSLGGWVQIARQLADAGAAAIELNVYFVPGDLHLTGAGWAAASRYRRRGPGGGAGADRGEAQPVLLLAGQHGAAAGRRGCRRVGAVPASVPAAPRWTSRHSPWKPSVALSTRFEDGCRAPGSRPWPGTPGRRWRPPPGSRRPRT